LVPLAITLPASCVYDTHIVAGAAIQYTKVGQKYQPRYAQSGSSAVVADRAVIHVCRGSSGSVVSARVGVTTAATGAATTTVDVQKNGTTILSATVSVGTTAAYTLLAPTISVSSLVAGDVLEVVVSGVAAGGGTLAKGVFAVLEISETPA